MIAHEVWSAIGDVAHYIEPFFGSGAVLLKRPRFKAQDHTETCCDKDGHLANVWRALQADPDGVAKVCDWPVNHADLIARKKRLVENNESLIEKLCADDAYYDTKIAGYWIWAASCWIGHGLTCPNQRPHLSDAGIGVHAKGKIPHLGNAGMGVQEPYNANLYVWFRELSERLRYVRVVCGDWSRVCGGDWQSKLGTVGVFFDPPYGEAANRCEGLYGEHDSLTVADDVRDWCLARGNRRDHRIVLAGYYAEHESLLSHGWRVHRWSASGGYANLGGNDSPSANRHNEALFFSPHCLDAEGLLFSELECLTTQFQPSIGS
jgi:hypothetical protein